MGFEVVSKLKVLGPYVAANGSTEEVFEQVKKKVNAAYFVNSRKLSLKAPASTKMRAFENATQGVIAWAGPQLYYSETFGKRLDNLQLSLYEKMCPYAKPTTMPWAAWSKAKTAWAKGHTKKPWSTRVVKRQK